MLYKKGDALDPMNYRPIALLNTLLKLFTQLLQRRITNWATSNNLLQKAQGGFRKGRGCDDQIFCLNAALQLNTRKKKRKVFALFVDFERAFSSIPQDKLWKQLFKLGLSGKIIVNPKNSLRELIYPDSLRAPSLLYFLASTSQR
jgi:hypothetical protein